LRRSKHLLAFLALALCALGFGVASATADAPQATAPEVSEISYTTAHVKGKVDPGGESTEWFFEVSTDGTVWERTNVGGAAEGSGLQEFQGDITSLNFGGPGLKPGTAYKVHLTANNGSGGVSSPETEFTTKSLPSPSVSIDPVTTFTDTTATFSGTINPNSPAGNPAAANVNWHFQCSPECPSLSLASGSAPNPVPADNSNHAVSVKATGLEPNTTYHVTLVGQNAGDPVEAGPVSFTTSAVLPQVETVPAFAIQGGTEALVAARINPHNSATTYWIKYGTTAAYGNSAPASEDASAGSGGTWQVFSQKIAGLSPSTVYHLRVFAKNATGEVEGADETFETAPVAAPEPGCPNATLRAETNSTALPDCRAYEQVSPVDKNGFDASLNADLLQPAFIAASDGSSMYFESAGAFADAKAAPLLSAYLSSRGADGWETRGLAPPQTITKVNAPSPAVQWFTPNLRFAAIAGGSQGHLASGDTPSVSNLYLLDTGTRTYQTLNLGGTSGVNHFFVGGSADGSRQFFEDANALAPGAITGVGGSGGDLVNLYEWRGGQLKLASIILGPSGDEEPAPEGARYAGPHGELGVAVRNLVSTDGSRVVFTDAAGGRLYLREDGERTLAVSAGAAGRFIGASADDSKIFFRSEANLTPDASGSGGKLYRFEPETETLTNLFAGVLPGEPQAVSSENPALGVSEDGEYVYFLSASRFHSGDNPQGGSAFYLWHNGEVRYIAPDNGSSSPQSYDVQARVSPDGQLLSFTSTARLTAYDNTDSVPAGDGSPRHDREVYVYDAKIDRVTCVSCNPSGQPPTGAPNGGPAAGSSFPIPPTEQIANLQPGVRNDGSIFFNSRDALVSADVNGKMDVYEWKEGRVHLISSGSGGVDSFYASSSASGNDAFFATYEPLLPSDKDDAADIYDARVGGGFPQAAEPILCGSIEGCHGAGSSPPPFSDPASGSFSSSQKLDPKAQRLRKALKACKHKKKKKAKARCRKAAKKRYGKASNGRGH
jgi:hypothetical protein